MNKKILIALADAIREQNSAAKACRLPSEAFTEKQISKLADFCAAQNPAFNRDRWLSYIAGECGANGGKVKK